MDVTEPTGPLVLRHEPLPADARELVIAAAARTGRPMEAAETLGYSPLSFTKTLDEDPDFSAAIEAAKGRVAERLEAEADRRAVDGWEEPVFFKGVRCGTIQRFSDNLLELRLKAVAPQRYRTNVSVDAKVAAGVLVVPAAAPNAQEWSQAFGGSQPSPVPSAQAVSTK